MFLFINSYNYKWYSILRRTFTETSLSKCISHCTGRNNSFWTTLRFYVGGLIFTMTILFSWKLGRAILHHKSESFNYGTDNDDKRCVIRMQYQCHHKERICSQLAICVSVQDKTHWWLIDTSPSSIFIELMLSDWHRAFGNL